jgi:succinyldiaminopimelate transaminase
VAPAADGLSTALPDFPWDALIPYAQVARAHPDGVVDLSVGTPVDPTPELAARALADASNAPGYPLTAGTPALREAVAGWYGRCHGVTVDPAAVLPTLGSKELVAWLPTLLRVRGPVVIPPLAYPTYEVGARIAGCLVVRAAVPPVTAPGLVWLNSPANPTGQVLSVVEQRAWVTYGRAHGVPVVSDECYLDLPWDGAAPRSVLHPDVCDGDHTGLLAVHSLSKRSNLAGYRAAVVAGDPALVAELLAVRRHAGMIVPRPVQAAMTAAYGDDTHVAVQRDRYGRRRKVLRAALTGAGFRIEHSGAGLYLWATRDEDCWETVAWLAERGVLVAPGTFYGPAGERHVRVALTAHDDAVDAVPARLA